VLELTGLLADGQSQLGRLHPTEESARMERASLLLGRSAAHVTALLHEQLSRLEGAGSTRGGAP
jgi:hypothetical protein